MNSRILLVIKFAVLGCLALIAFACSPQKEYEIRQLTVREMPPGRTVAVAYMQIENHTEQPLVFNYVHSSVAESVEVHEHVYDQGKMKMRPVRHLSIEGNSTLNFAPGGYHLMLQGVDKRLLEGDQVEITFEFNGRSPDRHLAIVKRM